MKSDSDPRARNAGWASGGQALQARWQNRRSGYGHLQVAPGLILFEASARGARASVGLALAVVGDRGLQGGERSLRARRGAVERPGTAATGDGGTGMGGAARAAPTTSTPAPTAPCDERWIRASADGPEAAPPTPNARRPSSARRGPAFPGWATWQANGDLEYGTTAGWYGVFGGGGTLLVSDTTAAGFAHGGRYSAQAPSGPSSIMGRRTGFRAVWENTPHRLGLSEGRCHHRRELSARRHLRHHDSVPRRPRPPR